MRKKGRCSVRCKVCGEYGPRFLWHGVDGAAWFRCSLCHSDSSSDTWDDVKGHYNAQYLQHNLKACEGQREKLAESQRSNLDWFDHFGTPVARTFLDVGCNEGCALDSMEARGWAVRGFDVNPAAGMSPRVVIGDQLKASLFDGQQFGAIMLREVIEHIPDWRDALREAGKLLLPGGLLQVQTPRPVETNHELPYCHDHLHLFDPYVLKTEIERLGCEIVQKLIWDLGQLWIGRKL